MYYVDITSPKHFMSELFTSFTAVELEEIFDTAISEANDNDTSLLLSLLS